MRLQFASGCIANLTASRVSTERVRKLRLFQPHEYISTRLQPAGGRALPGEAAHGYRFCSAAGTPTGQPPGQPTTQKAEPLNWSWRAFSKASPHAASPS